MRNPHHQVEMLSNQTQALTRERQKLEAEAAKGKSHQSTMSKAVKNLVRQARGVVEQIHEIEMGEPCAKNRESKLWACLLYTSPSPRDRTRSRMPSSA